ncbi:methyl-accepting chemotaxis protein [Alsobacter sp. KACC 23698]|uniref:Methyl-accepting chemotaxis protein n=1 Tax=Alsobacter sp. KACC 23698 TaxID=3149229 RepID=A0AAU7JHJ3_9HYPH
MNLVRLFKLPASRPDPSGEDAARAAPEPSATEPPHDAPGPGMEDVLKQLEDDVLLTMRVIGYSADDVQSRITETLGMMDGLRDASLELSSLSGTAFKATTSLAHTTQQLERTGEAIEQHVAGTDEFVQDAQDLAKDVTLRMEQLSGAVDRIAGVVAVIGAIARQTNLLALNASIEAARAGAAGRGFAVVATEVKQLAGQVQMATGDISAQISMLQTVARESGSTVGDIARLLGRVGPVLGSVKDAVRKQIGGAREVASRASESLQFVSVVSDKSQAMTRVAADAAAACQDAGQSASKMVPALHLLTQRSTAFLRHTDLRDRRSARRLPVSLRGQFRSADGLLAVGLTTVDLSEGGALASPDGPGLAKGMTGLVHIDQVGAIRASVRSVDEEATRLAFHHPSPEALGEIRRLVADADRETRPLVKIAQGAAMEIASAFEAGLAAGRVRLNDLITVDYRRVPGTDPIQYLTDATPFYDATLPPILERVRRDVPECFLATAVDRNAYLPVHHPEYSKPQRPDDFAWNDIHSRNRRILERSKMLVLARNQEAYQLAGFMRHQGGADFKPVKLIAAPIFVGDGLWGNVMLAVGTTVLPPRRDDPLGFPAPARGSSPAPDAKTERVDPAP